MNDGTYVVELKNNQTTGQPVTIADYLQTHPTLGVTSAHSELYFIFGGTFIIVMASFLIYTLWKIKKESSNSFK